MVVVTRDTGIGSPTGPAPIVVARGDTLTALGFDDGGNVVVGPWADGPDDWTGVMPRGVLEIEPSVERLLDRIEQQKLAREDEAERLSAARRAEASRGRRIASFESTARRELRSVSLIDGADGRRSDIWEHGRALGEIPAHAVVVQKDTPVYFPRDISEGHYSSLTTLVAGDTLWLSGSANIPRAFDRGDADAYYTSHTVDDIDFSAVAWARDVPVNPTLVAILTVQTESIAQELRDYVAGLQAAADAIEAGVFESTPDLLITEFRAIGGYSTSGFRLNFQNLKRGTSIDYLRITVQPYNRVGDPLTERNYGGRRTVSAVGPAPAGVDDVYTYESDDLWYTDMVECVRLVSIQAEYQDGRSTTWRRSVGTLFDGGRWDNCSER